MHHQRVIAAAGASVLLLGALTACNNTDAQATGPGVVAAAAAASSAPSDALSAASSTGANSGSSVPSMGAPTPGQAVDASAFVQQILTAVRKQPSAHVTAVLRMRGQRLSARGDIAFGPDRAASITARVPALGGRIQLRYVDGTAYVAMPPMTPPGKFMKLDPGMFGAMPGADLSHRLGPRAITHALRTAVQQVVYVGPGDVAGTSLAHYRVVLDRSALGKHAMSSGMMSNGSADHMGPLHLDIWLDAVHLPHRVRLAMPGTGRATLDLSHWGEPVHVTAP
jgi:hypothetical protein